MIRPPPWRRKANSAVSELSGLVDEVLAFVHAGIQELEG
jgi:hypothetical protein